MVQTLEIVNRSDRAVTVNNWIMPAHAGAVVRIVSPTRTELVRTFGAPQVTPRGLSDVTVRVVEGEADKAAR